MEILSELVIKFGVEIVAGGVVLAVRWFERRMMKSSFMRKMKEVREAKQNEF